MSFLLLFSACNPQAAKSLLSGPDACVDGICNLLGATEIVGELSLTQNSTATQNIEQGDLVEINGTCQDLGRKEQRIIVQVFPIDDDPAVSPYIDNSISKNCQTNSVGLLTSYQCIFVTIGNGLTEVDSTTGDIKLYPQCINGQFSYKVRLGSVSKVGAVVKNYLVRTKLRTINPIGETGWNETKITRNISAPKFKIAYNLTQNICQIRIDPYKYKDAAGSTDNIPNILYAIKRQEVGFTAVGVQNPAVIPAIPPHRLGGSGFFAFDAAQIDLGDSIANFSDGNRSPYVVLTGTVPLEIQPGIKYSYYTQAQAGSDVSELSTAQTCDVPAPTLLLSTVSGGNCQISISTGGISAFNYEWQFASQDQWSSTTNSNAGQTFLPCSTVNCTFNMAATFPTAGKFHIAVRSFDGANLYGKWSNTIACTRP